MTASALELCCTIMNDKLYYAKAGPAVRERVLPQALNLVKSSLLQGQALQVVAPSDLSKRHFDSRASLHS